MKKVLFFLVFVLALAVGGTAFAGLQDFVLENQSASSVCYVYVSPQGTSSWEEDVLPSDQCLEPGQSVRVSFSNAGSTPVWDLRVEDNDGNYEEYYGFDLSQVSHIIIHGGGNSSYR